MSRKVTNQILANAAIRAHNIADDQTKALMTRHKMRHEIERLRGTSYQAQEKLLALLHSFPSVEDRKALAEVIADQLKEKRVDTGDLSSQFCRAMSDAGVPIYPPPWPYDKWCE